MCLTNSPETGSTFITSAPWSARIIAPTGPETMLVRSKTFTPFKGPIFF